MVRDCAISVRVSDDVKAAAQKAAEVERRTLASYVEKVLVERLEADGHMPKAKGRK
jgi:hypothetical protein